MDTEPTTRAHHKWQFPKGSRDEVGIQVIFQLPLLGSCFFPALRRGNRSCEGTYCFLDDLHRSDQLQYNPRSNVQQWHQNS